MTKMCKLSEGEAEEKLGDRKPRFKCKCGSVARKEKQLCSPKKFK
ncbi:hypothetical protein [Limisalsivibrio acetivorans]|nr:hypothetical protein [Limisalsivibrio acetivorans]